MSGSDDNSYRKIKIAEPDEFDGSDWPTFANQMAVFLSAKDDLYREDKHKILFMLSYMKEGDALAWANDYTSSTLIDPDTSEIKPVPSYGTFKEFWKSVSDRFSDPNLKEKAHRELMALTQGRKTAVEFFHKFDELRIKAGYSKMDDFCIRHLKTSLHQEISRGIITMEKVPVTYDEWKKRAIALDDSIRGYEDHRHQNRAQLFSTRRPPPPPPPQRSKPPAPTSTDRKDATGTTFGGLGQPMEGISHAEARRRQVCFRCAKKGHWAKDCPFAQQVIRQSVQRLSPEDKADLAREVALLKESEFVGVNDQDYVDLEEDRDDSDELSSFLVPEQ